jgi:hypothetical protein
LDTPDGKQVKLNSNGTWQFVKKAGNGLTVHVPKENTSRYVDKFKKYTIWFDPNQWYYDTVAIKTENDWDAYFHSIDMAVSGYVMSSRLSMSLNNIEEQIRDQWKNVGTIMSFSSRRDTINELPVTVFDMLLDYEGITFQYRGNIYSTPKGSFQLVVGTQKEVFEEDIKKIEKLFQGIKAL